MYYAVAFSLFFPSNTHIDAVSHVSIVLLKYRFSNRYYNIRISALPRGHLIGYGRLLNFLMFTLALIREGYLKEAVRLFESLRYLRIPAELQSPSQLKPENIYCILQGVNSLSGRLGPLVQHVRVGR